jgi:hypothetical protein
MVKDHTMEKNLCVVVLLTDIFHLEMLWGEYPAMNSLVKNS